MTSNLPIVIIGGGHAAARAAAELRDIGCEEPIFIVGNEEVIPYERPPLSKEVISESVDPATGAVYPVEFYSKTISSFCLANVYRGSTSVGAL